MKNIIIAQDQDHLKKLIKQEIELNGHQCNLNHIDVSKVIDLSNLFQNSNFDGDISNWNTSNVQYTRRMFKNSKFNGDISKWNTSNVTDMEAMFYGSLFNGDISKWHTSNVSNMIFMFFGSQFNNDISQWNVSKVQDMGGIFKLSQFNQALSEWKPYSLIGCKNMFHQSAENIPWWYSEDANEIIQKLKLYDNAQNLERKLGIKESIKKIKI